MLIWKQPLYCRLVIQLYRLHIDPRMLSIIFLLPDY